MALVHFLGSLPVAGVSWLRCSRVLPGAVELCGLVSLVVIALSVTFLQQ
jgi:hypothetical protein